MRPRCLAARWAALTLVVAAACTGRPANPAESPSQTPSPTAATTSTVTVPPGGPPLPAALAAVTIKGDVELLNPATGAVVRKLASGATGDEISLTPDGTKAYYMSTAGCQGQIMVVPTTPGATPTVVARYGAFPAVNPQGTKLAYIREPPLDGGPNDPACAAMNVFAGSNYGVIVRDLATGAETVYGLPPRLITGGLPLPVDHLAWFADGHNLLVSIAGGQDNEQWNLFHVDTAVDKHYVPDNLLPVRPLAPGLYYRETVPIDAAHYFAAISCCLTGGSVTPTTLDEIAIAGITATVVQQLGVGRTNQDNASLDADAAGAWLLWLSGSDLQVVPAMGGAKPTTLASGLLAADW